MARHSHHPRYRLPAAIFAVVLIALAVGAPARPALADVPRLVVTGEGEVAARPDIATLDLGVRTEAATAAEALAQNSQQMARVLAVLADAGIAPRDMQTSALSLDQILDRRSTSIGAAPKVVGFAAQNRLGVTVRDLAALGGLIDRLVRDAGGEAANSLGALRFGLADPGPAQDEARRRAVADARARAQVIAEAAGLQLGAIQEIREGGGGAMPMAAPRMLIASDAVPIEAGEVSTRAAVTIVWTLVAP